MSAVPYIWKLDFKRCFLTAQQKIFLKPDVWTFFFPFCFWKSTHWRPFTVQMVKWKIISADLSRPQESSFRWDHEERCAPCGCCLTLSFCLSACWYSRSDCILSVTDILWHYRKTFWWREGDTLPVVCCGSSGCVITKSNNVFLLNNIGFLYLIMHLYWQGNGAEWKANTVPSLSQPDALGNSHWILWQTSQKMQMSSW